MRFLWMLLGLIAVLLPGSGIASAQTQPDYFVEAVVNNTAPFVGQQVVYTFRLYTRVSRTNRGSIADPAFDGFWQQAFGAVRSYDTLINGISYNVKERSVALFPLYAGEIRIAETTFVIPDDPFNPGEVMTTEALPITVRGLPPLDGFPAAGIPVGQFEILPSISQQTIALGDPITLQLLVKGDGNLQELPAPDLQSSSDWRVYGGMNRYRADEQNGTLVGEKLFEWVLTPIRAGDLLLPAIRFIYFEPVSQTYRTLDAADFSVQVLPGELGILSVDAVSSAAAFSMPLKAIADVPSGDLAGVIWMLVIGPVVLVGLVWFYNWRQVRAVSDTPLRHSMRLLKQARHQQSNTKKPHVQDRFLLIREAMVAYVAQRIDCAPNILDSMMIHEALRQHRIDPVAQADYLQCLELAAEGVFAPHETVDPSELTEYAIQTLIKVEQQWQRCDPNS
jgi:hypothetical protein